MIIMLLINVYTHRLFTISEPVVLRKYKSIKVSSCVLRYDIKPPLMTTSGNAIIKRMINSIQNPSVSRIAFPKIIINLIFTRIRYIYVVCTRPSSFQPIYYLIFFTSAVKFGISHFNSFPLIKSTSNK